MKSKKNLLKQLEELPYFDKNTIKQLGVQLGLGEKTVDAYVSRFLRGKEIYGMKNGLYVSRDFFEKNRGDVSYTFFLANILRTPSYVSSWAALQYYNLTTEAVYSVTSVTRKVTRGYETKVGNFTYQSIDLSLFSDFILEKGTFSFFVATPSKALFDVLYFKTRQFRGLSREKIMGMIEELRIDFDEMSKEEQEKFYAMIKKYE